MPELAEVEFYRKQWNAGIGDTVRKVHTHPKARLYRDTPSAAIARGLTGRVLVGGEAHGKRMLFAFSEGAWLGLHLGMTGKLYSGEPDHTPEKAEHLVLEMDRVALVFSDSRMFGKLTLDLVDDGEPPVWWRDLPPRPLDRGFTKRHHLAFVRRFPRTPLKTLLLDQRGYPGIGNWMADEICWRLRVPPSTRTGKLDNAEVDALWRSVRQVSRDALRVIGDTWERPPDSWLFNHRWKDGGVCPRKDCRAELVRADLRGRTTCWCPRCQGG